MDLQVFSRYTDMGKLHFFAVKQYWYQHTVYIHIIMTAKKYFKTFYQNGLQNLLL